jgi:hypothetical protein
MPIFGRPSIYDEMADASDAGAEDSSDAGVSEGATGSYGSEGEGPTSDEGTVSEAVGDVVDLFSEGWDATVDLAIEGALGIKDIIEGITENWTGGPTILVPEGTFDNPYGLPEGS